MLNDRAPLALVAAAIVCCCTAASAGEGDAVLRELNGGSLSCRLDLSLGFLYGAGARPDGLGSPVSTVRSGGAGVTGNPAGLAFLASNELVLDASPGLGASVVRLLDAEERAASALDDAIEDFAAPGIAIVYPDLDGWVGQTTGVISGAAAFPLGRVTVGAAIEEPLSLSLGIVDTGIEALAETVKGEGEGQVEITARCFFDAAADVSLSVDRATVAVASRVTPGLALGASLSRVTASASLSGTALGDGIVDYGGQQYAFNDPNDPWHNELGASAHGDFAGSGIGWTAGVSWRPSPRISVDAAYVRAPTLSLSGRLTTIENAIPAVSEDGVDVELISASQPTLTEEKVTVSDDPLELELPSYFGATASARVGFILTTLEYRRYVGALAYTYDGESEGIELGDAVGAEFDLGVLWAGGGLAWARVRGGDGAADERLTVPFANVGFSVPLRDDLGLDALVLAVPVQLARLCLSYRF